MRFLPVEYTRIRHRWWVNKTTVAHFPAFIPREAEDVRVFFFPGLMMAGRVFELGMQLPADAVHDIAEEYANYPETVSGAINLRKHCGNYTYNDERGELPEHFTIRIIHGEPQGTSHKGDWNHGCLSSVAYSRKTNQVVYVTNTW